MKAKIIILLCAALVFGCKKAETTADDNATETAQNIGDAMASVDESSGNSSGQIAAYRAAAEKTFARLAPEETYISISKYLLPNAEAASCSGSGFESCGNTIANTITRTFGGCTVGLATFTGTVTLTWTGTGAASCTLPANGDMITRNPNFTVTGRRGATLAVSKTGTNGQSLTRTGAGQFSFSNDGINRKFTGPGGTVLFDQTTSTVTPINVSGANRAGRVMTGGALRVTNNLTAVTCDYTPTSLTWTGSCNCPTSGSWAATCSNGNSSTLTITGCGVADFTDGSFSGSVTFDRCGT